MRLRFDEAHKAQPTGTLGHAKVARDFIGELYRIERSLWERDQPITAADRVRVRQQLSAPIVERFHAWLEALAPQVSPQSLLGRAVYYTLAQ